MIPNTKINHQTIGGVEEEGQIFLSSSSFNRSFGAQLLFGKFKIEVVIHPEISSRTPTTSLKFMAAI